MNLSAAWQFQPGWQLCLPGSTTCSTPFYYEHLSKSVHASQAGLGYEQVGRIPEPGRAYWLSVSYRFFYWRALGRRANRLSQVTFSVTDPCGRGRYHGPSVALWAPIPPQREHNNETRNVAPWRPHRGRPVIDGLRQRRRSGSSEPQQPRSPTRRRPPPAAPATAMISRPAICAPIR